MIYAYFGIRYPIIFGFSEVVSSPLVRKNLDRVSFSYIKKRVKKRKKRNWAFARETAFSQARSLKLLVDCSGMTSLLGTARSSTLRHFLILLLLTYENPKSSILYEFPHMH